MEQSSFVKAATWTVAILAIVLVIYPSKVLAFQGSPVTITGGSIRVNATTPQSWSSGTETIPVTGKQNGQLFFDGVQNFPSSQSLSGWVMKISNKKRDGTEKADAIIICSSSDCGGNSFDPNKVYLHVRAGSRWEKVSSTELSFHDSECGGQSKDCDVLVRVKVEGTDNSGRHWVQSGKCSRNGDDGHCQIGIGPRQ
ncbi:hypothetical protein [Edaphobacter bradus]|uniref:hypothetical protein n=1 Tax=Edaphobacter bradus TaxID=2259016 RepID=UPI0021DF968A|nr:hypothetical protein [Edaphobacter bradus]